MYLNLQTLGDGCRLGLLRENRQSESERAKDMHAMDRKGVYESVRAIKEANRGCCSRQISGCSAVE